MKFQELKIGDRFHFPDGPAEHFRKTSAGGYKALDKLLGMPRQAQRDMEVDVVVFNQMEETKRFVDAILRDEGFIPDANWYHSVLGGMYVECLFEDVFKMKPAKLVRIRCIDCKCFIFTLEKTHDGVKENA